MLYYPPVWNMLVILCASKTEEMALSGAKGLAGQIRRYCGAHNEKKISMIGPADAAVAKVNDVYKKVIYLKTGEYGTLVDIKDEMERFIRDNTDYRDVLVQFDFNPVNGF